MLINNEEGLFKLAREEGKISGKVFLIFSPIITTILAGLITTVVFTIIFTLVPGVSKVVIDNLGVNLAINTGIVIFTYFLILKFKEKRKLSSIGLKLNKRLIPDYLKGFVFGILMIAIVALGICLFGGGKILVNTSFKLNNLPVFLMLIVGWMIQGASEEVMMRGYMLQGLGVKINPTVAIIISSVFFSALHLLNNGINTLSLINLSLFGAFAAFYAIKEESIWGICALHSAWNFAQGNLFGFLVSGIETGDSLFIIKLQGDNLVNGGSFGPEGGVITTLVLSVGIAILLYLIKNKSKNRELNSIK